MGKTLNEIAQELKDGKHKTKAKKESVSDIKVHIIYAFNGTGKTRLSRVFRSIVDPPKCKRDDAEDISVRNIIYYNAFTEDLFYWDNDLLNDTKPKLKIQPNVFTKWIFEDQGQDLNVIRNFQHYTDEALTPHFNSRYIITGDDNKEVVVPAFSEVAFSYERGNDGKSENIKISKGEESCFIWSIFYSLLEQIISVLNVSEPSDRETNQHDSLEYVFIDDPVSSMDDNHLIEIAVNLAQLIKSSKSELKFIITTHNSLFYNVLHNEFNSNIFKKHMLKLDEHGKYELVTQKSDSPFSYHLFLKQEIEKAISTKTLKKYHFNYFRNILEKTSTFLGYEKWGELLPKTDDGRTNPYESRIINISSHSKHAGEEVTELSQADKRVLTFLLDELKKNHKFKKTPTQKG